jgi:Flp pilus assembly protein TadG
MCTTRGPTIATNILRAGPRAQRASIGQAVVEFALIAPLFFGLFVGFINIASYGARIAQVTNMARQGARYASLYPEQWSAAATPPAPTIEGQIESAGDGITVPNTDSNITIAYYDFSPLTGTTTECGYYSAASGTFVATGPQPEASCISGGNLVQVTLTASFVPVIPVASFSTSLSQNIWMVVE